jgi:predicted nucleic acid-binding protein
MIGLDTGFFLELLSGSPRASEIWKLCVDDRADFAVSFLTLFEIERLGLKGKIKDFQELIEIISLSTFVVWPDLEIVSSGARLSYGLGIPAIDSIILACLKKVGVNEIYTTDKHLASYRCESIVVTNLKNS